MSCGPASTAAFATRRRAGELRRGLPVGFVWGEADGEVRFHPDEAVVAAIRNVFASFAQTGSARRVWLWFRSEGLTFPLQMHQGAEIRWVEASYTAIHHVLTNPVYAGAYAYGKSRRETMLNASASAESVSENFLAPSGRCLFRTIIRASPIGWTYEANEDRIAKNTRPGCTKCGREGRGALCQGLADLLATCGRRFTRTIAVAAARHIIARQDPGRGAASIAQHRRASKSTRPSPGPSSPPSNRQSSPPLSPPRSGSRLIARPRSGMASRRRAGK